jgi:galacturonosyltransferase
MGLRKASCVFFQNTENEKFFNDRNMAPGHHHLLPGSGVNTSRYAVMEYPNGETIDFLFIARVMKNKGIDQYLDAAKAIKAQYPNTVFHIVGGCDDERYIKELQELEGQGIVKYHGQQNSVLPFQKISSCTIHPTYYPEGMSNVLLESAACARPIITTNQSGCREIIDDGVNGFICKQKDSADLIRQIEKFLALTWEQRRDMGLAGRAKVEREFDRQLVVDAYMEEIETATGKE